MIRIFKNLGKKDVGLAALVLVLVIGQVELELKLPDYMAQITKLITMEGSAMGSVFTAGAKMMLCAFGSLALSVVVAFAAARISSDFSANTRKKLFDTVQSFSMAEMNRFSTASLITRTTNDVTQVQMLIVLGLQMILRAPIMAGMALFKIQNKSWQWTAATAAAVVILLVMVGIIVGMSLPRFRKVQTLTDEVNRVMREHLTGLKVVRAYNAEGYQEQKFAGVNNALTDNHLFTSRAMAFLLPSIMLVMNGLSLSIYWIGAALIDQAGMLERVGLLSDMIVFTTYAMQIVMSFMMLVMIFILLPRASVSAKRILEVLDTEPSVKDGAGVAEGTFAGKGAHVSAAPDEHKGEIQFENVAFRYPDSADDMISEISFKANRGETVAIIGSTGCGKSTLINLIPRFYDATAGRVLVDGVDVKDYTLTDLRNRIGYVSQSAVLFAGSIEDNITYGDNGQGEIDVEQMKSAAAIAEASSFIDELEEKFDSHVAQNGSNYSGGQRQRLSIARAIARHPEILIFDDSFSALDYRTDRKVRTNLAKECVGITKIIVAQRIGTIKDADRILVMDDGRIVGQGTHKELMENCEVYRDIAYSQLSEKELQEGRD